MREPQGPGSSVAERGDNLNAGRARNRNTHVPVRRCTYLQRPERSSVEKSESFRKHLDTRSTYRTSYVKKPDLTK